MKILGQGFAPDDQLAMKTSCERELQGESGRTQPQPTPGLVQQGDMRRHYHRFSPMVAGAFRDSGRVRVEAGTYNSS